MPSVGSQDQVDEIIDVGLRTHGIAQGGRVQALCLRAAGCGRACAVGQSGDERDGAPAAASRHLRVLN